MNLKISICIFLFYGICGGLIGQWEQLPDRMYPDADHFPFQYGVASGDPTPNGFIIWTRIEPRENVDQEIVLFLFGTDPSNLEVKGELFTDASVDWTIHFDVQAVPSNTTYYYQFSDVAGNYSAIGRARTAPDQTDEVDELKFAVASCSSIYSGYFNAYARIAERDDLNAVIHLGDYIYDFADEDELIRIPEPTPIDPMNKEEFWQRHRYYLLDPDLRALRQQHPLIAIWDNHDLYKGDEESLLGSIEAFYNYLPIRRPDIDNPKRIYRSFEYGTLADLMFMDIELLRNQDIIENTNENSLLGNAQYNWLTEKLSSSTAKWRIIGNQKLFSNWSIEHIAFPLPFGNEVIADPKAWDGFPAERERLLNHLYDNDIGNNIILSGDIHLSIASDLVIDPRDESIYNSATGDGAIGVEFVPASITRGNVDETLGLDSYDAFGLLADISNEGNPHHRYLELFQHGYGLLHIQEDSTIAQFIYSPKHEFATKDTVFQELVVLDGENHWARDVVSNIEEFNYDSNSSLSLSPIFPNPAGEQCFFTLHSDIRQKVRISILRMDGAHHGEIQFFNNTIEPHVDYKMTIDTKEFVPGTYVVHISDSMSNMQLRFIKI